MNEFLLRELFEVLHRPKFKRRVAKLNSSPPEITVKILQMAKIFPDMGILRVVEEDPDDNWVISCALASESKYIITGDSHLLKIGGFHDIAILKPQQFLSRLKI